MGLHGTCSVNIIRQNCIYLYFHREWKRKRETSQVHQIAAVISLYKFSQILISELGTNIGTSKMVSGFLDCGKFHVCMCVCVILFCFNWVDILVIHEVAVKNHLLSHSLNVIAALMNDQVFFGRTNGWFQSWNGSGCYVHPYAMIG